jgi:hypothetical protein
MADDDEYGQANPNEAVAFDGFGGHKLAQLAGPPAGSFASYVGTAKDKDALVDAAAAAGDLGLTSVEQVVAVAAIPDPNVREELKSVLGLEDDDAFKMFVEQVKQTLPRERRALLSEPADLGVGLGVVPPSDEEIAALEDTAVEIAVGEEEAEAAAPPSANLIFYLPPIRQQGPRGTCVSFTLTALNEYVLRRRGLSADLSEQHLYYEIKRVDNTPDVCGTRQVAAVEALADRGQCPEYIWPYNPNTACNTHGRRPQRARPEGLYYRLHTSRVPPRDVPEYRDCISRGHPVTLSIPVYNSWFASAETRRSGRITLRLGNEPARGGHAVLLVGYQDDRNEPGGGHFILRNSWGTSWGYQCPYGDGYGTIFYQYIVDEAWEAFTA